MSVSGVPGVGRAIVAAALAGKLRIWRRALPA